MTLSTSIAKTLAFVGFSSLFKVIELASSAGDISSKTDEMSTAMSKERRTRLSRRTLQVQMHPMR